MSQRLLFIMILGFWLAMNGLLVYREFGGGLRLEENVPFKMVWEKILEAPDPSTLQVSLRKNKIGYLRWAPNIIEDPVSTVSGTSPEPLEGRIRAPAGYTLDLEANIIWNNPTNRLRGSSHIDFDSKGEWEAFSLRIQQRPAFWELEAKAGRPSVTLRYELESAQWEREISYELLRNPQALLRELGMPGIMANWMIGQSLPSLPASPGQLALGLQWSAYQDWMRIGHSRVRVYRVQARILDRYQVSVYVSRVGEILKVEVPNELLMLNEAIAPQ